MLLLTAAAILAALTPLAVVFIAHCVRYPSSALALFAAVVPYGSTLALPGPPLLDNVSSLIGAVAVGAYALHLALSGRAGHPVRAATAAWTLLLAVAALTALWSVSRTSSVVGVAVLASLVLLYVLVAVTPVSRRDVTALEAGLVIGGAAVGIYAVYLGATGRLTGAVDQRFVAAVGGSETDDVADPNITAASLLLPFVIAVAWTVRPGRLQLRLGAAAAASVMFIAVFLTGSRGGLLGLVAGVFVLILLSPRRGRALAALLVPVVGVVVAVAVAPSSVTERISSDSRSSGRADIWRIAVRSCPEHCAAGSGWATFAEVHEERLLTDPTARGIQRRFQAHSLWLGTLVEGGVVALALLLAGLGLTYRELARVPREQRGPPLAGLAALVVSSTFLATLSFKYFWFVLMYAVVVSNLSRRSATSVVPRAPRKAAAP